MGTPKEYEGHQYPCVGSLHNLSLDEFITKHLDNFDHELVKNVLYTEESQIIQNPSSLSLPSSSSSSTSSPPIFHANLNPSSQLTNKTIDDDWNGNSVAMISKVDHTMVQQWQGQGIMPVPVQAVMRTKFEVLENSFGVNKCMDLGYFDDNVQTKASVDKSSDSQSQSENKHAFTDKLKAKTIERRRRRMIKNRESAARSRARKQAYTNQLQHNLLRLQETNNWLKKKKEVEMLLDSTSTSGPTHQLRRTNSNTF